MSDLATVRQHVAPIWARLLGMKTVAGDDNFFALGGHSLLGVKLIAAVQGALDLGDELKLSDLFEHPTLDDFCGHVAALAAPDGESGAI